jgi:hypothetical protein
LPEVDVWRGDPHAGYLGGGDIINSERDIQEIRPNDLAASDDALWRRRKCPIGLSVELARAEFGNGEFPSRPEFVGTPTPRPANQSEPPHAQPAIPPRLSNRRNRSKNPIFNNALQAYRSYVLKNTEKMSTERRTASL